MIDSRAIVKQAHDRVEERRATVRERLESVPTPAGFEEPSDQAFLEWWRQMLTQYPPVPIDFPVLIQGQPMRGPDGQPMTVTRVMSPLAAAYGYKKADGSDLVDGGPAVLARVDRLMTKGGAE